MKRNIFLLVLATLLVLPASVEAQRWKLRRYEAYIGAGTTHPFMDVGNAADGFAAFQFIATRPGVSAGAGFRLTNSLVAGVDLSYFNFGGTESVEGAMPVHRLSVHSFEHVATVKYYLIADGRAAISSATFNRRGMVNNYNSMDVYLFAGAGGNLSKSKAFDVGNQEMLNASYHNTKMNYALVFPMGLGVKYSIDAWWSFGVEVGGRITRSDMIDGYAATVPANRYKDRYITSSFRAIYKIRNDRRGRPIFSKYGR